MDMSVTAAAVKENQLWLLPLDMSILNGYLHGIMFLVCSRLLMHADRKTQIEANYPEMGSIYLLF
jgi:hypothetical protein